MLRTAPPRQAVRPHGGEALELALEKFQGLTRCDEVLPGDGASNDVPEMVGA